jgi:hypothetical protein
MAASLCTKLPRGRHAGRMRSRKNGKSSHEKWTLKSHILWEKSKTAMP